MPDLKKILRNIDSTLYVYMGFIPDFTCLDYVAEQRPLFTKLGLIKERLSMIPFTDVRLKNVVKKMGGWEHLTSPNFIPSEIIYAELETAGLSRTDFDKSRRYLANPREYRNEALRERYHSNSESAS